MRKATLTTGRGPRRIGPRWLWPALLLLLTGPLALSACSSSSSPAFDLTAPRGVRGGGLNGAQLVVAEPNAIQPLGDERILARDAAGSVSYISGAQWADRLPVLVQTRLIQTFENASRLKAVGRPGDGIVADYQLNTELRAFQLDAASGEAFVEISVKLLNVRTGKVVNSRLFSARMPVASAAGPVVAQALDGTLARVLADTVRWVGSRA